MSSSLPIARPPASELEALTSPSYAGELWIDCLKDCNANTQEAERQYSKVVKAIVRKLEHPHSESADSDSEFQSDRDSSSSSSSSSAGDRGVKRRRTDSLKWEKPGPLSRRVGMNQSVLRTLANARVVRTMKSPGGHRLFNVASVMQYIASTTENSKSKNVKKQSAIAEPLFNQRQLLVYLRLHGADHNPEQLNTISDRVQAQVLAHYKDSCTMDELQSCIYTFELDSDQPGRVVNHLSNTPGTRRLLKSICNRHQLSSLLILRSTDDISSEPSTYSFFNQICRNMNVATDIVPELNNTLSI